MSIDNVLNTVIEGDSIEEMRRLPSKSVDLIVIDPPYNIGKDSRWDKFDSVDAYIAFMGEVFMECERVLKDNGSFYWFHNDMTQIRRLMDEIDVRTSFVYKQFIVWNKRFEDSPRKYYFDNVLKTKADRNFRQMAEYCLYYSANSLASKLRNSRLEKSMSQNDVDVAIGRVESKRPSVGTRLTARWEEETSFPSQGDYLKLMRLFNWKESYEDVQTTFNNQHTHHSVWNYEVAPKLGHITPKPVELIENIIRHSSNEGDIVLDCFGGSGTAAVAAKRLGRKYILIERETEYVELAEKRIKDET